MAKSTKKNKAPGRAGRKAKPKKLLKAPKLFKPKKLLKPKKLRRPNDPNAAPVEAVDLPRPPPPLGIGPAAAVLDRLWSVVMSRRTADPAVSHSARLLLRGTAK